MEYQHDYTELIKRYINGSCTAAERKAFLQLIDEPGMQQAINHLIEQEIDMVDSGVLSIVHEQSKEQAKATLQRILHTPAEAPVISMRSWRKKWWRLAAAAVIIIITGILGYIFLLHKQTGKPPVAIASWQDIQPGRNGALLTLNDGRQIVLDIIQEGQVAQQGNVNIVKQGDALSYVSNSKSSDIVYNTITTTRGRQYANLILSDGTKVWLDAASSIRFPASFTGSERTVQITGQVWFEVAHKKNQPFRVMAKGTEITDLGTVFNVNAYEEESMMKVTLLEGAIQLHSVILKPGQQAQLSGGHDLFIKNNINADTVVAWKNGYFSFTNANMQTVMRQLSRWYDVDISYQGHIADQIFNGDIGRNLTLKEVLEGLAFTNVKFRLEPGRKLVILP